MKLPLIALALLALSYAVWSIAFASGSLKDVQFDSKLEAFIAAKSASESVPNSEVRHTRGRSNSFSGVTKFGYVVVVPVGYSSLQEGQFVVYQGEVHTINHRLRIKTHKGWIAEGDGNRGPDKTLVTADNLIGVVHDNKAYRY